MDLKDALEVGDQTVCPIVARYMNTKMYYYSLERVREPQKNTSQSLPKHAQYSTPSMNPNMYANNCPVNISPSAKTASYLKIMRDNETIPSMSPKTYAKAAKTITSVGVCPRKTKTATNCMLSEVNLP
jgi:hypothetical protein